MSAANPAPSPSSTTGWEISCVRYDGGWELVDEATSSHEPELGEQLGGAGQADGARSGEISGGIDDRIERGWDAEDAHQRRRVRSVVGEVSRRRARRHDGL